MESPEPETWLNADDIGRDVIGEIQGIIHEKDDYNHRKSVKNILLRSYGSDGNFTVRDDTNKPGSHTILSMGTAQSNIIIDALKKGITAQLL